MPYSKQQPDNSKIEQDLIQKLRKEILDLKKELENLKQSEENFRSLVEGADDIIFWVNKEGIIKYINPAVEAWGGCKSKEFIGHSFFNFIHKKDLPQVLDSFKKVLASQTQLLEFRISVNNKETRWVRTLSRARAQNGEIVGIQGILIDITERKKAEEALRENEERFRAVIETAKDAIFIKDQNFKFTHLNAVAEKLFGRPASELIGTTGKEVLDKTTVEMMLAVEERIKAGETVTLEYTKIISAKKVTYQIIIVPIRNKERKINGLCGIARDITARKQTEEDLRLAKERAELVYRLVPSAIFTVDIDCRVTSWNKMATKITGYEATEIIGKPCSLFADEPCRGRFSQCPLRNKQIIKPVRNSECIIICKDGRRKTVLKNVDLLVDNSGQIIGGIESFIDITERKQMEADLRARNEQLEKINKMVIGRELKMIELKKEIRRLKRLLRENSNG